MTDAYVTAVQVDEIFADPAYQRTLDVPRARKMAGAWDRRLAGVLEVSDRGHSHTPRYAVIDGQHRWAAAKYLRPAPILVANVHTGLTVADEAKLFHDIAVNRRQLMTWDRWNARRGAGDRDVLAIEECARKCGLEVSPKPVDGSIRCTATLEKIVALGELELLEDTLRLVGEIWGKFLESFDAPIVHGIAFVLHYVGDDINLKRLTEALIDVVPRQIKARAVAMRETRSGVVAKLVALVVLDTYNRTPGPKIKATVNTFGTSSRNAHSAPKTQPGQRGGGVAQKRQLPPLDWAKCGTSSQYRAHLRRDEKPCAACRDAESRRVADSRKITA